jgi:hypothetical protein
LFGFFEFLVTANIESPTKIIALEATMAALLCLHEIITCQKKTIWTEENFFVVLAIPCTDPRLRRLTEIKR